MLCQEKSGGVVRQFKLMSRDCATILDIVDKCNRVSNFLYKDAYLTYSAFLDDGNVVYLVDNVGTVFLKPRSGFIAEVHITFWDGRLRGREAICLEIGRDFLKQRGLREGRFVTAIPADRAAVIAFAKRVGFKIAVEGMIDVLVLDLDV